MSKKRRRAAGGEEVEVGFSEVYTTAVTTNNNTWNLSGAAIGDPPNGASTRHIIVVITAYDGQVDDDTGTSLSVTLGGVAVTQRAFVAGGSSAGPSTGFTYIGIVELPTGTTANLSATLSGFSGAMDGFRVALYRAMGLSSPVPTTTPTGTTSITLVVPANGFGVVGAANSNGTCDAFTGTGAVTTYSGFAAGRGAAMYRTSSGSVVHDSTGATMFRGATWTFV